MSQGPLAFPSVKNTCMTVYGDSIEKACDRVRFSIHVEQLRMSNAKDAASALDVGTTHVVSGVEIEVLGAS